MKVQNCRKISILILILFLLASCDNMSNPIDPSNNGSVTVTTYRYIVPAMGNIVIGTGNDISNWGGWTSIPIDAQGAYVVQEGDSIQITAIDPIKGGAGSGVNGTVFMKSTMGNITVYPDGKYYAPIGLTNNEITASKNCYSPVDWGVAIPTSYKPCIQKDDGTCTPSSYPVLTPTGSLKTPSFSSATTPQMVYGPSNNTILGAGDMYLFVVNGTPYTAGNGLVVNGNTNPCGYDASTCSTNGPTSGGIKDPSCVTPPKAHNNCTLVNGQGLDILTCKSYDSSAFPDFNFADCTSFREPQLFSPFIAFREFVGDQLVPGTGPGTGQPSVKYTTMLGGALNQSGLLYPADRSLSDPNDPLTSTASSLLNLNTFSILFGTDIAPAKFDPTNNNYSGGQYLAFKIDPNIVAPGNKITGSYNITYFGYSPKDMVVDAGVTTPYSSGDLVYQFATTAPSNINPPIDGMQSYAKTGGVGSSPTPGTMLYMRVAETVDGCYKDNTGYYQVTVVVTNTTKVKYGWFARISSYVINFVVSRLQFAMTAFYNSIVGAEDFIAIVKTMLTLYIMIYGAYFVLGMTQATATDLLKRVVKMALMFILISPNSLIFFNTYLFGVLTKGFMQIVTYATVNNVVEAGQSPQDAVSYAFAFVDTAINVFFSPNVWLKILVTLSSLFTVLVIPMFIHVMFVYFKVIIEGFIGYLVMLTSIYFMVGMFPLFAIFILFDYTRKYFWGWLNYTLNFCLQPILFFIMLAFMNHIVMLYLNVFIKIDVSWGCWLNIWINISQLVVDLASYLPKVWVPVGCIDFFTVEHPFALIMNGFALMLIVKALQSMLDFVPVLSERLLSSGFGAADPGGGGGGVAPGAMPGMTGGGEAGFGREKSLARIAYDGGRTKITSLFKDEKTSRDLKQEEELKHQKGGSEPAANTSRTLGRPDGLPIAGGGVGSGGAGSGTGGGFRPPSLVSAQKGTPIISPNVATSTAAGSMPKAAAPSTSPTTSATPLSTKDAIAKQMEQYGQYQAPGLQSFKDDVKNKHAQNLARNADSAGGISGVAGATASADSIGKRSAAQAGAGSGSAPIDTTPPARKFAAPSSTTTPATPASGVSRSGPSASPSQPKGKFTGQNPLFAGRTSEQFRAEKSVTPRATVPRDSEELKGPTMTQSAEERNKSVVSDFLAKASSQDGRTLRENYGVEVANAYETYTRSLAELESAKKAREYSYGYGLDKDRRPIGQKSISFADIEKLDLAETIHIEHQITAQSKMISTLGKQITDEDREANSEKFQQWSKLIQEKDELILRRFGYSHYSDLKKESMQAYSGLQKALEKEK